MSGAGAHRKRYDATVEKGENAWRREWSSFMTGVNLKRVRDGSMSVALKASADLEQRDDDQSTGFSYLFNTAADKKLIRARKQKEDEETRRKKSKRSEEDDVSKHQRALTEAQGRGLKLEGMTRKEKREFLHLTKSKEQEEAAKASKEFKLHELMDERVAWYQQGPHPIDIISEKLVTRKADKRGKQLGLRYNYLLPHPSWMARRTQRRREGLLVGLGRRFVFDEETGQAMDPLRNTPVDMTKVNLLLCESGQGAAASTAAAAAAGDGDDDAGKVREEGEDASPSDDASKNPTLIVSSMDDVLVDPRRGQTSYVRAVVKNRAAAMAIKQANLTTTFLSSSLVQGPNIGLEDKEELNSRPHPQPPMSASSSGGFAAERRASARPATRPATGRGGSGSSSRKPPASSSSKREPRVGKASTGERRPARRVAKE